MLPIAIGALLIGLLSPVAPAKPARSAIDLVGAKDIRAVRHVLSLRLVDIFRRSRAETWQQDSELKRLVNAAAEFDLREGALHELDVHSHAGGRLRRATGDCRLL